MSSNVTKCFFGITKVWPFATGLASRIAKKLSESFTFFTGIFPFAILQKRQSCFFAMVLFERLTIKTFLEEFSIDAFLSEIEGH